MAAVTIAERSPTPEDFDELYTRVWDGYTSEQRTDIAESYNRLSGNGTSPTVDATPQNPTHPRIQRPTSTAPSTGSPRRRRPLPPTPGGSSNPITRPYSEDSSVENRRLPSAPRAQSVIERYTPPPGDSFPSPAQTSRTVIDTPDNPPWHPPSNLTADSSPWQAPALLPADASSWQAAPTLHADTPPWQAASTLPADVPPWQAPATLAAEDPMDDSSSLYPSDSAPPLPVYERVPGDYPPAPSYYADSQSPLSNGDGNHSYINDIDGHPSFSSSLEYFDPEQSGGSSSEQQQSPSVVDMYTYDGNSHLHQSTSDLSYVESLPRTRKNDGFRTSFASESPSIDAITLPPTVYRMNSAGSSLSPYIGSSSDRYLNLDGSDSPGPSNLIRRPTELLREMRGMLELHDDIEDEYWDEEEEEPDRFVNFSLLSHLAVQLRDKVPRGTHVKGSIPYPRAFTGKDIVSTIQSQISRELVVNHKGTPNDRRAALQVARSLQGQLMFYEVEWGSRILQDGVEEVYMFLDDDEGSNAPREALPTSVVTILARCYSPSCGEGPECYAYGCPRKGDSLTKLLPSIMEAPSNAVREAWPKTVAPEVLLNLTESEINRQIIIHKLISKEEQYIKDLDLVDSVFMQPLRRAQPPVITPSDRLENFIDDVFHNILDLRECNRRFLEVLYVRQREQAPVIGGIGDILLDIATEFRDSYPAYIGNHPLAERRMKDELENNPEFRLFIEECSRQPSVRQSTSMRLDLRHFLNRPSEHLQKYPVLLQAICKATARGSPDIDFLGEAIDAIKNLQGVAQLRTFQSAMGRGVTGKWGWQDLVSPEVRRTFSNNPDELKRQSLIFEFVKGEMLYVKDLENIGTMYIRALKNSEPPIIPPDRLDRFIRDVFHNFAELRSHHRRLVNTLHEIQCEEHPRIKSITAAVFDAALNFRDAYLEYIPNYPIAACRIEEEMDRNPEFGTFVENCIRHPDAHRTPMKDFLNCPLERLLKYVEMLKAIRDVTPRGHEDLRDVIEIIEALSRETEPGVASSKQKVQLWTYNAQLVFRPGETMDLDLLNESRSLIYTGKLLRQPDSGSEANGWNELFVLVFDNYLVMTKPRVQDGITKYHVAKRPIPLDLITLTKFTDHPTLRGSVPSIRHHRSATSTASASSNSGGQSENGDSQNLYPFTFHHNGRFGGPMTMYAELSATRLEWKQKLEEAMGLRKVVQESNKVFEIETLSMHTFTVPPTGHALTPSTWSESSPITGKVTCSIPFNTPDGRRLVAIGCAEGIWIGFRHDSSSMRRVLHLKSVTQCTMLDDFGLFLVLANKELFAYHIEALVPTPQHSTNASQHPQKLSGNKEVQFFSVGKMLERTFVIFMRKRGADSYFHVLEPVLEKIHERPKAPSGMWGLLRSPKQEWFKSYKEFVLSTETYDLIFLKARIAILSKTAFEIMNLHDRSSTRIPQLDPPLAPRSDTCRPIGIFRSQEHEFLLCYSEFGIYVDKQGVPSRKACIIEWEGIADSVAFHAPYVLLFDPHFIEIRHVETGRLSQIVPGHDMRCVWDGRGHSSNNAVTPGASSEDEMVQEAHVHAVMNHPEPTAQPAGRPLRPVAQHVFELIPTIPLYLPGSLASPSTATYFPHTDSYSPPRSPQLRPSTSYIS
ncbi:CNH domain-containing protein [Lyophyllum atratum]|nr:CNH domain-containing protein [Lyophyllum atratum]